MTYTSNVPQPNQTVAGSRPQIQNNFGYIDTVMKVDHQFNNGFATLGTHKQCSMADQATPAVPAGTNGVYYVKGSFPYFTNGTSDFQLGNPSISAFVPFNGAIVVGAGLIVPIVPTVSGNVGGNITFWTGAGTTSSTYNFWILGAAATQNRYINPSTAEVILVNNAGVMSFRNVTATPFTVHYFGWYYPTV